MVGLRGGVYNCEVESSRSQNSGDPLAAVESPKPSLIFRPWAKTVAQLQGETGVHSKDEQGVDTQADRVTGLNADADGKPINRG